MMVETKVQVMGVHYYPTATGLTEFLRHTHGHLFEITVVASEKGDREVEFIQLYSDLLSSVFQRYLVILPYVLNFGSHSCEIIAVVLKEHLKHKGYSIESVRVSEVGIGTGYI